MILDIVITNNVKIQTIMATQEQFEAVLSRIDTATTDIAADIRSLKEPITNAGLTQEIEDMILSKLDAAATKLEGIGAETPPPETGLEGEGPAPENPAGQV